MSKSDQRGTSSQEPSGWGGRQVSWKTSRCSFLVDSALLTATTCRAKSACCLVCPSRCRSCKYLVTLLPPARYLYLRVDWTLSSPFKQSLFRITPEIMHSPSQIAVLAALLFLTTFVAAQSTPAPSITAAPRPSITAVSECHPHGTMQ
jgi:hypothetical protein